MKKTSLIISFISLLATGFVSFAQAQTQILTAIPPRLEIKVKPGEFVSQKIQFRNESENTVYLTPILRDFIVSDTAGNPNFVDRQVSGRWAASSWMNVSPSSFSAAPNKVVDLSLSVTVPPDALPGGHYAAVLYEAKGSAPALSGGTAAGSGINQVVGTLVYITVEGPVTEIAHVKQFDTPRFLEFGPVPFTTEILNSSDIHLKPGGVITVYDMFGKTVANLSLEERNIFPGASFVYKNTWETKYLFGRYSATLNASYGTGGQVLLATIYFIGFPLRIALAIVLAIIIIILLIIFFRRHKKQKELAAELEKIEAEKEKAPGDR